MKSSLNNLVSNSEKKIAMENWGLHKKEWKFMSEIPASIELLFFKTWQLKNVILKSLLPFRECHISHAYNKIVFYSIAKTLL